MTYRELLQESSARLKEAGIESPLLDAEVIIAHAAGIERHRILVDADEEVTSPLEKKIKSLVDERSKGRPVAYITGEKEFYSLTFHVDENVLIPRPETELLVDMAVYHAPLNGAALDLCTGSGCIAVALKHSRGDVTICASDNSPAAVACATENSNALLGPGRIDFACGDLFEPWAGMRFDVIVSNPPYVNPALEVNLQRELTFEPEEALYCDDEGRSIIRRIIEEAQAFLGDKGVIILEIGSDMKDFILETAGVNGYGVSLLNDYGGLTRVATLRRGE